MAIYGEMCRFAVLTMKYVVFEVLTHPHIKPLYTRTFSHASFSVQSAGPGTLHVSPSIQELEPNF
jgi:hypothetical protein